MNDAVLAYEVCIICEASLRDKYVKRLSKLAAVSTGYTYNNLYIYKVVHKKSFTFTAHVAWAAPH